MNLAEKQQILVSDLNLISDPHERLSAVVGQASARGLPDSQKTDVFRVSGCVSSVWLVGTAQDGKCYFRCDADSPMVKGLVTLLCELYSGATPEEVEQVNPDVWTLCGFDRLLSPTRMNGLRAVRERIRALAGQMNERPPSE